MAKKAKRAASSRKAKSKGKQNTPTDRRGSHFANNLKHLIAIQKRHDGKPFNKRMLADWLQDDFDRDMDAVSDMYMNAALAAGRTSIEMPIGLRKIQPASRDRNAERAIKGLEKIGIVFTRTDEHGTPVKATRRKKASGGKAGAKPKSRGGSAAKVWWKYDSTSPVLADLEQAFARSNLTGYELEGMMGCAALLENFYGLKMEEQVRHAFARLTAGVPQSLLEEASHHGLVWKFLFRRPGKYEPQKKMLQTWNDATILRQQCTIQYASKSKSWMKHLAPDLLNEDDKKPRQIAAFGTVFIPQEDSLYLVGSQADRKKPGFWQPPVLYKLDRTISITLTDDPNPPLANMPGHARVAPIEGLPDWLNLAKLFTDSIGAFFHYGEMHSVAIRVHDPVQIAVCIERPFHARQSIVDLDRRDPTRPKLTLKIDHCFLEEVIPSLLAMQAGFAVIEPPELVEAIKELAEEIAKRHPGAGPALPDA